MDELIILNDYLKRIVKNNTYCKTCLLNHNGICFFAYDCIAEDFMHYLENENADA